MLPVRSVAHHGIEDGEELSGDGDVGHLRWFRGCDETLVHRLENRVEAGSVHGSQVECCAGTRSTGTDPSMAGLLAAVVGERCDADERCDLPSTECSELGQFDDKGSRDTGTDAGDVLQAASDLGLGGVGRDCRVDAAIELDNAALEHLHEGQDISTHHGGSVLESVLLSHDHCDELTASLYPIGHLTVSRAWNRPERWGGSFPEERENVGIDRVCLRKDAQSFSQASHPPRVDDEYGKPGFGEGLGQRSFVAARGLDDDSLQVSFLRELTDETLDFGSCVPDPL